MSNSGPSGVHPVLTLINRCDELARNFDSTFEESCILLTNLANNTPAPGQPTTMDDTLMSLRKTLEKCEEIVGAMLNCIYEDIPHLLDQLDSGENVGVGNWNPKQALDGISQLFYPLSRQVLLAELNLEMNTGDRIAFRTGAFEGFAIGGSD
ncbi:hypothetical protein NDA11_000246 [Ustilago hordei]|uniref:Uncharacterized protein n=1 Tax=Ustilago hordei TaxID=120017 RepID=I2FRR6_USTHO|nr:hypothetical protein NDA10_003763 [Ustilago hordei]KAJ1572043.1 hypothetical protein NDA15_003277 [Ustilago hordei]KAJ1573416.1 hypothetical protein NDA11_000246 [Ustilago hordei]KAJ1594533.1 hypothetical protein NDA12_007216 [Ustilago hordei]KAJ1598367.1 hypothetical protein NDA14_006881 [Ustilago hordei]